MRVSPFDRKYISMSACWMSKTVSRVTLRPTCMNRDPDLYSCTWTCVYVRDLYVCVRVCEREEAYTCVCEREREEAYTCVCVREREEAYTCVCV